MTGIRELSPPVVVGVGRFTSPDVTARMIKTGRFNFFGFARPFIADPFLPRKIDEGRISCNICITGDLTQGTGRCRQNPTWMVEWQRVWHPEKIVVKRNSQTVLIYALGRPD